jgi:type III secretion protein J
VVRARVLVVLPERGAGGDPTTGSTASVFIKYRRGHNLNDATMQVKRLVAHGIPGLAVENVSVVLLPQGVAMTGVPATSATSEPSWWIGALVALALLVAVGAWFGWRFWRARQHAAAAPEPAPEVLGSEAVP